jgi:hypothetical protein
MEVKDLKEKLHALIESSSEDTLEYMYSFFEEEAYTDEFKKELDADYDNYQQDKAGVTREEMDAMVNDLLNK